MYKIDNILVKEYFELKETSEYDIFIETIKPKNSYNGVSFDYSKLTFDEVELIKNVFTKNVNELPDIITELYCKGSFDQSKQEQFNNASVFDLFRVKAFMQEWIENIIKREINGLSGIPDEKLLMINASERLSVVSHLLTKMRLAEQFSLDPDTIGRWKYNKVFSILVANKRSNDVQMDYQKQK